MVYHSSGVFGLHHDGKSILWLQWSLVRLHRFLQRLIVMISSGWVKTDTFAFGLVWLERKEQVSALFQSFFQEVHAHINPQPLGGSGLSFSIYSTSLFDPPGAHWQYSLDVPPQKIDQKTSHHQLGLLKSWPFPFNYFVHCVWVQRGECAAVFNGSLAVFLLKRQLPSSHLFGKWHVSPPHSWTTHSNHNIARSCRSHCPR